MIPFMQARNRPGKNERQEDRQKRFPSPSPVIFCFVSDGLSGLTSVEVPDVHPKVI